MYIYIYIYIHPIYSHHVNSVILNIMKRKFIIARKKKITAQSTTRSQKSFEKYALKIDV